MHNTYVGSFPVFWRFGPQAESQGIWPPTRPSPPSINEQWHAHDTKHDLHQLFRLLPAISGRGVGHTTSCPRLHTSYTLLLYQSSWSSKKSLPWADIMRVKYLCPGQTF